MKKLASGIIAVAMISAAAPALADDHMEVSARDDKGRPTMVMIDGKEYAVCTPQQQDSCINPREAGLNFGNRALDYWPGQPASADDSD